MTIESQIKIDMALHGVPPIVNAMQSDANTRVVKVSLFANGVPFVPNGCIVSVTYKKPDGTSGWYDKLPDETEAVSVTDNVVTAILAPQVLTAPGNVYAAIRLDAAPNRISSFPFIVSVTADPGNAAEKSENYYSVQNWDEVNSAFAAVNESMADAVHYTAQEKTAEQKWQARRNIDAVGAEDLPHRLEIYCNVKEKDIRCEVTYAELLEWLKNFEAVTAAVSLTIEEGVYSATTSTVFCDEDRHVRFDLAELGTVEVDSDGVWSYREASSGGNANIDDTTVGAAAWSSRNIVDKLCPSFTESGAAVSVAPMEGYPLSVVSAIEPTQKGSGDPRPAGWVNISGGLLAPTTLIGYGVNTSGTLTVGAKYKLSVNAKNAAGERVKLAAAEVYDLNGTYSYSMPVEIGDYDVTFTMELDPEDTSGLVQVDIGVTFAEEIDESTLWQYDEGGDMSLVDGAFVLTEYDPGNVRPITGFDSVTLWRGGKNLFNIGVVDSNNDGAISISGRGRPFSRNGTVLKLKDYAPHLVVGETYTLSAKYTHTGSFIYLSDGYNRSWKFGDKLTITQAILDSNVLWYNSTTDGDTTINEISDIQIELGSTATAYEPYRGDEFAVEFGQTVYGGSLDWQTGVLTVDQKLLTVTGTEQMSTEWLNPMITIIINDATADFAPALSNMFKPAEYASHKSGAAMSRYGHVHVGYDGTLDEFKSFAVEQNAAGTPVQVCYKLATPITVHLDPTQILALSGENTLTSDTGDTTVSGRADLVALVTKLQETVDTQAAQISTLQTAAVNNA